MYKKEKKNRKKIELFILIIFLHIFFSFETLKKIIEFIIRSCDNHQIRL